MYYGKFRYEEQKKAHEARQKQKIIQIKEVKFRPQTDDNDYLTKIRKTKEFLLEGDKAKITVRFRGRREKTGTYQEFGMRLLERVKADLEEWSQVESMSKLEVNQMIMVLVPKKKK
jgi:translation initiation factor IF-3